MCSTSASNASNSSVSFTPEPEALRITRTVLFSLIAALALVGNYVVCRAVWRFTGAKPIAHYLVSNLAFAEIINMVCTVFMFHAYEPPWSWELGSAMCKILAPIQLTSSLVITASLAILAVYRCVLLIKPMITKPTRRQTCRVILICWAGSIGLSVPAGHFRVLKPWGKNCELRLCEEEFPQGFEHYQNIYSIFLFVVNFVLPFVIMAISYSLVDKKIREHIFVKQRLRDEQNKAMSTVTQNSVCTEEPQSTKRGSMVFSQSGGVNHQEIQLEYVATSNIKDDERGQQRESHDKYVTLKEDTDQTESSPNVRTVTKNDNSAFELENDLLKMIYALVLVFVICYIPYQVNFLLVEFQVKAFMAWPPRHILRRHIYVLGCLPSALHPVCYGMMSKFYHKAFIRIIACRKYKTQNAH